jgi:hypothetical protein
VPYIYDDLILVSALGEPTKRTSVRAKFSNQEVVMLYDTGSSITCMNADLFERLSNYFHKNNKITII